MDRRKTRKEQEQTPAQASTRKVGRVFGSFGKKRTRKKDREKPCQLPRAPFAKPFRCNRHTDVTRLRSLVVLSFPSSWGEGRSLRAAIVPTNTNAKLGTRDRTFERPIDRSPRNRASLRRNFPIFPQHQHLSTRASHLDTGKSASQAQRDDKKEEPSHREMHRRRKREREGGSETKNQ